MANIATYLNDIKNAIFGKEVRGSIHDGIKAINDEVESTTARQVVLENTFDQLIINAGNSNAENVAARVKADGTTYETIGKRMDDVDSQLEQKAKQIDLEVERARIDSFTTLKEGSTTGDAELVDGRVGADGFTYKNIGDSIRNQLNKKISIESGKNKFNKNKLVKGFLNADGTLTSSENYFTTEFIPVKMNNPVSVSQVSRKFLAYDEKQTPILESYQDNSVTNYTYTPSCDGYIRITTQEQYFDSMMITYTPEYVPFDEYEPYKNFIPENIYLNDLQIENQIKPLLDNINKSNVLYGKKWVACGDSFTEGDFIDSLTNNYIFTDGLYKGKNKVYPYYIGDRNNMDIINEAKCGTTITHIDGRDNAFIDGRYKNIPTDADYITLRFGINDKGYNVPLGTIDDEVNNTFYGAWNIVLRYLITNHPTAKIGIIVSNGMQTEDTFPSAIIAVARKWGISYLDIAFDDKIPLVHRTNKDYVCQEAKDLRFNTFVVNPTTNWHPNEKAHEYESTFIENWLKSL